MPLLSIAQSSNERRRTARELGTLDSRKQHFVLFLGCHGITNIYLEDIDQKTKNEIFASYTSFLCLGCTIKQLTIMSKTIKQYLKAASDWVMEHSTDDYPIDPQHDKTGKRAMIIQGLLDEQERWETIKNKKITEQLLPTKCQTNACLTEDCP